MPAVDKRRPCCREVTAVLTTATCSNAQLHKGIE
jgi:hypothetical protein